MMVIERTLSILKPDAMRKNQIGEVIARLEKGGLKVVAAKMLQMARRQAEIFYAIHRGRPFYDALTSFMSSAPVVVMVLEGEDAISRNREIMGATDPADAAVGTIRGDLAASIDENMVHGSDGPETAKEEIGFFFPEGEVS